MILVAGLTPAWQQILVFDSLTPGKVNRASAVHWCASGKVVNAARALHHLRGSCKLLTIIGGTTGAEIQRDVGRLGIPARWIETTASTRVCSTILNRQAGEVTELVADAGEITVAEREAFVAAYAEEAADAAVIILIGSLPPGAPADFYGELLERTPGKAILDVRGANLLQSLCKRPFLVKPNRDELEMTFGRDLSSDSALWEAMRELNRGAAEWAVITNGGAPLYASRSGNFYEIRPLQRAIVNPIGCGDCMAAGIALAIERGLEPLDAIRYGTAVAAVKLGRLLPGEVDPAEVDSLMQTISIKRVGS